MPNKECTPTRLFLTSLCGDTLLFKWSDARSPAQVTARFLQARNHFVVATAFLLNAIMRCSTTAFFFQNICKGFPIHIKVTSLPPIGVLSTDRKGQKPNSRKLHNEFQWSPLFNAAEAWYFGCWESEWVTDLVTRLQSPHCRQDVEGVQRVQERFTRI